MRRCSYSLSSKLTVNNSTAPKTISKVLHSSGCGQQLLISLWKNHSQYYQYSTTISECFGKWIEKKKKEQQPQVLFDNHSKLNPKKTDPLCLILLANPKYEQSLQLQQFLFDYLRNLKSTLNQENSHQHNRQFLIATEHSESCFTIGKLRFDETFSKNHMLNNSRQLPIHKIGRGGGITFHCRGQLVLYPLFDLENSSFLHKNVKWFSDEFMLRSLCVPFLQQFSNDLLKDSSNRTTGKQQIQIKVGGESEMGIYSSRLQSSQPQIVDVCTNNDEEFTKSKRKLASIGLQLSRFVSMHGVAMNLSLNREDLHSFRNDIVACGLHHVTMTSLAEELRLQNLTQEGYLHMMDLLVSKLSKCNLNVDQIVYLNCQDPNSQTILNFSEQEISPELLKFIEKANERCQ